MKAESKAEAKPAPITGTLLTQLRVLAAFEIVLGIISLALLLAWIQLPGELLAFDDLFALFKPSLGGSGLRTVFQSQVLFVMGILMLASGAGLIWPRTWAWTLVHTNVFATLLLSAQIYYILFTQGSPEGNTRFNEALMVFQGFQVGIMVFMTQKEIRTALRVTSIDFIVAAVFACILALDWNVTLYSLRAGGM